MLKIKDYPGLIFLFNSFVFCSQSFAGICPSTTITTSITCSGNISTIYNSEYGIHLYNVAGTGNTYIVNISGNISTVGDYSNGVLLQDIGSSGNSHTVNISGNISTAGEYARGILFNNFLGSGNSKTANISGNISTVGDNATGILFYNLDNSGNSNTANISGNISTVGASAHGLDLINFYGSGHSNTINITGNISTIGDFSRGIYLKSSEGIENSNLVIMTGNVSTTGSGSYAIELINDDASSTNIIQLNKGSSIIGGIKFSGTSSINNILKLNLGAGVSYSIITEGAGTIIDLDNRPMVTGSAYAAGIGAQETASEMLYQRTSAVTSALDRRLRSYASDEVDNQPYWLDVYYSDVNRNSGGNYSTQTAFSNYNYGITAGFKLPVEITPMELVVNVAQSNLNIDSGAQKIDSTSLMAGVLAPSITDVLGAKLSAKAMLGYAEHDGDRKVMTNSQLYDGSRQIKSDYKSVYGVLGAALTKIQPLTDNLSADVLLGLDLNVQRYESYKESDYFAWDGRTLTQLQSRVQAGLNYAFNENKASVFARVGAENRNLIDGATQDYEINNTNVSFNTNNKNDTYLTAQVGIKAQLEKRIQLFGVMNTLHSSDSVNSVSGNIGLRADF